MKKYTEITVADIEKLTLEELNQYIEEYGKQLIYRISRVKQSKATTEHYRALIYSTDTLRKLVNNVGLDNLPDLLSADFKQFRTKEEAQQRLLNLVSTLKSKASTVTGQKQISRIRHTRVREKLKELKIKRRFTNPQLDVLDRVFAEFGHGREEYTSGEIIEEFSAAYFPEIDYNELIDLMEIGLNNRSVDTDNYDGFIFS